MHAQVADDGHKHCAGHVVTAGRHLLSLINEVLDIARIEAGRVELSMEPVVVDDILAETLDLLRPAAAARGTLIEMPRPFGAKLGVMADRKRFKQVLLNLLSNAIKYSQPDSRVVVDCRTTPPWQVHLSVQDFGPGIAPDKLARLFVAFDRLGAEDSLVQGTGLGLALSKHLVEAMGGQIGVESAPGKGSTFWVRLPQSQRSVPALLPLPTVVPDEPVTQDPPMSGRIFTVLYIEDNPSNMSLVEYVLAQRPQVRLLAASRGGEGMEIARREQPDMILLDLHLPDMTGFDVLTTLRTDARTRAIPVAGISADATRGTIARLLDAGACAYLSKPLNVEHLLHTPCPCSLNLPKPPERDPAEPNLSMILEPTLSAMKILIVDDEPANLALLAIHPSEHGLRPAEDHHGPPGGRRALSNVPAGPGPARLDDAGD